MKVPEAVLCVPGPWASRSELVECIVRSSGGYISAGGILMHLDTKEACQLQLDERDERMSSAFIAAGPHWSKTPEMARINDHQSVAYLIGHGGSAKNFSALMLAARGLLDAGGLGVKIESTGLAHSPAAWRKFCEDLPRFSAHRACVVFLTGSDVYSCGMHNLGLRDALVENFDQRAAVALLNAFTRYLFIEEPSIRDGQTFCVAKAAPVYRILDDPGISYEEGSLFANPYGFWRLQPA